MRSNKVNVGKLSQSDKILSKTGMSDSEIASSLSPQHNSIFQLRDIETVVFLGSSLNYGMVGGSWVNEVTEELRRNGVNATAVDMATPGNDTAANSLVWESNKATYTDTGTVVVIHTLGNDVSNNRPYSSLSNAQVQAIYDELYSLVTSVYANGNIPLLVNTTFRNYDGTTINNEDAGSLPFNDGILKPCAQKMFPNNMYGDLVYIDPYDMIRNNNSMIFADGDAVHLNASGYGLLRRFFVENIIRRINGASPRAVDRIEDPSTPTATLNKCVVNIGLRYTFDFLPFDRGTSVSDERLLPLTGYVPSGITVDYFGGEADFVGGQNNGALDTGDLTKSFTSDHVKEDYIYTTNLNWVDVVTFKGLPPNQSVVVEVCAWRDAIDNRIGEYSIDGGLTFIEIDASSSLSDSNIGSLSGTSSPSGEVTLKLRRQSGSSFCYVSAFSIETV